MFVTKKIRTTHNTTLLSYNVLEKAVKSLRKLQFTYQNFDGQLEVNKESDLPCLTRDLLDFHTSGE